jgi:hypothetical protein
MSKPVKRQYTVLSLNERHDVLLDLAAKVPRKEICLKYKVSNPTVTLILKNKDKIEDDFQTYSEVSQTLAFEFSI